MITKQVIAISLRLFAIWLLVQLILTLPNLVLLLSSMQQYQQQSIPKGTSVAIVAALLLVGFLAVFLISKAANSALAEVNSESESTIDLGIDSQKVLLQLLGVYFVVGSLAYLPRSLTIFTNTLNISFAEILWPMGLIFQFGMGLLLILKSSYWMILFQKLRDRA